MEASDVPLVVVLQPTLSALFRDVIGDLTALAAAVADGEKKRVEQIVAAMAPADDLIDPSLLPSPPGTGNEKKKPVPKKGMEKKESVAGESLEDIQAGMVAKRKRENEAKARKEVEGSRDAYVSAVEQLSQANSQLMASCEPASLYTKERLKFFCSKPANAFLIEDVLGEWAEDNFPAALPALAIDPFAIARDHNARLEREYGYKPPRLLHEVGKVDPRTATTADLNHLIESHDAGGTNPMAFVCAATLDANATAATAAIEEAAALAATAESTKAGGSKKSIQRSLTSRSAADAAAQDDSAAAGQTSPRQQQLIACNVPDLALAAHPGRCETKTFTLWNSDTHRVRVRLAQTPHPWIAIRSLTTNGCVAYDPETPINPGQKLEFAVTFSPPDFSQQVISTAIKIGYAREMNNSKISETMSLSQWHFLELATVAATVMPQLSLLDPSHASVCFQPTFAHASSFFDFTVRNTGASGEFYMVTECSGAAAPALAFLCEPAKFVLNNGEALTLMLTFNPQADEQYEGTVSIFSTLDSETPLQVVRPQGKGVVPKVVMETFAGQPRAPALERQDCAEGTAFAVLDDAALLHTTQRSLVVRNDCELPIEFAWQTTVSDAAHVASKIIPSVGVFAPFAAIEFHVEITPAVKANVEALHALFVMHLPTLPDDSDTNTNTSPLAFMSRRKVLPLLPPPSLPAAFSPDDDGTACDAFGLFSQETSNARCAPQDPSVHPGVFCCAARFVADIEDMLVVAKPNFLQSDLPSLILSNTRREFTLVNHSSRPATFWLDPPLGEFHPASLSATDPAVVTKYLHTVKKIKEKFGQQWKPPQQRAREAETLTFFPQKGVIPGHSKIVVQLNYILKTVSKHAIDVECFIAELGVDKSPHLRLEVEACGASVSVEPKLLDYGVIPLGEEGEGRITVKNHNCVNLDFMCVDAQFHDPARFVFLPPGGHLLPGASMDVTVYRQGLVAGPAADVFEVVVANGNAESIEVRASIQQAACTIQPSIVEFGDVDEGMPSTQQFFLTNLTAVDIPYVITVVSQDTGLRLKVPESGTLHAGQQCVQLNVRAIFSGAKALSAVLALVSPKLPKPVPFEVRCSSIQQLSVALSIQGPNGNLPPIRLVQPIETYIGDLLDTILQAVTHDKGKVASYCTPLVLPYAVISDDEPYCAVSARITVENTSGCNSGFRLFTTVLTPMMSEYRVAPPTADFTVRSLSLTNRSMSRAPSNARGSMIGGSRGSMVRRSSSVNSTGSGTSQKIVPLAKDEPHFQSKVIAGTQQVELVQEGLLKAAQGLLQDGRGCAVQLANANNSLKPYGEQEVQATFIANLPGEYSDKIQVLVEGCPEAEIPITLTVRGKPILVDPMTSGLGPDATTGRMRLLLPEVVAGMTSVRRKLRVANRCPRDLEVVVALVDQGSFFRVCSVGSDASDASLAIQPAAAATSGKVVSPQRFILNALDNAEVVVEYAAPPGATGDWRANLTIASRIARTPFNDIFNIDEFYSINRQRYPATRHIASVGLPAHKVEVRGVPKIDVMKPLIDRPGIVVDSKLVDLSLYQTKLIAQLKRRQEQQLKSSQHQHDQLQRSKKGGGAASDSDDEDETNPDSVGNAPPLADGDVSPRSNRQLLQDDAERHELNTFLDARFQEQAVRSSLIFTETVIEIVAQNALATLVCDPAEMLRFPMCKIGGKCDRTIRLRNPTRTPLNFRASVDAPFRIVDHHLIPGDDVEVATLEDEQLQNTQAAYLKSLRNKTTAGGAGATLVPSAPSAALGGTNAERASALLGSTSKRRDPNSDPATTLYHLKPRDSVDIRIELTLALDATVRHQVEGELRIVFQGSKQPQTMPLLATVHVPAVVCEPDSTWFRPTVFLHDGKPQPKHDRLIKLVNYSACDAPFEIQHSAAPRVGSSRGGGGGSDAITRLQKVNQALQPTPAELHAVVVDDPSRFTLSVTRGVVSAATAGSVPGTVSVSIGFQGISNTHFECKYRVLVAGGVGHEFCVRGDSRETEI